VDEALNDSQITIPAEWNLEVILQLSMELDEKSKKEYDRRVKTRRANALKKKALENLRR
jgi:hypothetical protein